MVMLQLSGLCLPDCHTAWHAPLSKNRTVNSTKHFWDCLLISLTSLSMPPETELCSAKNLGPPVPRHFTANVYYHLDCLRLRVHLFPLMKDKCNGCSGGAFDHSLPCIYIFMLTCLPCYHSAIMPDVHCSMPVGNGTCLMCNTLSVGLKAEGN